ncbi:ornithine cyclodeaminase family protein [Bordetella sp. 15P40C-2]|uniref:ornithine cyclodeaminase family protein n=1 Tax=Bordetella sp. 15P40C-2 TaxID=2572246 RepID=UPI0013285B93|nr:ornithine cyclodeaminase family protein [Bordetella sp. 15P40C-2]MVW72834.1 ornithine cyclodeaminase family protein [Bordetella sp. 15P40C-2]
MIRYLSESDVRELLTMDDAIAQVERAFRARATGRAFDVPRVRTRQPGGHLHILQGAAPEINFIGYKAYYIQPDKSRTSLLQLINMEQGNLEAIIQADWLGQIRTGAATAVAIRMLARNGSRVLGLFGSGRHAQTQLEAVCAVCDISEVKVFGRDQQRVRDFCAKMAAQTGVEVRPATSRQETVEGSDIVLTITRSREALFDGAWLEPGQCVVAVGSNAMDRQEIDLQTVRRADLIVADSVQVAQTESGDLLSAYESGLIYWENLPDLGQVLVGQRAGRTNEDQIILFESHGMALQDIYAGAHILELARSAGLGQDFPIGAR